MKLHEKFISRCIELGKKGLGSTYPNPLVGSVIVHNEIIIGEGWHQRAGEAHAEVNAIRSVLDSSLLSEATIYVNLEPCSHFGRTPPCADLIISEGIKKVVIGTSDPNPKVCGRGIAKLKAAGCEVVVGVLEADCFELNKRFFTCQIKKRPYIFLKWAQSEDGFIAPETREVDNKPVWITNESTRQFVHKFRSEEAAIVVGTNTVIDDNPSLTTRYWNGKSPLRIAIDRNGRISEGAAILDGSVKTIIISEEQKESTNSVEYKTVDFNKPIAEQLCRLLFEEQIQSLIVEGGSKLLQTFIDENLWDEALLFQGNVVFGQGISAPVLPGKPLSESKLTGNILKHFKNDSH